MGVGWVFCFDSESMELILNLTRSSVEASMSTKAEEVSKAIFRPTLVFPEAGGPHTTVSFIGSVRVT